MKRLLVVPCTYTDDFRVRSLELARRWRSRYSVFVLRWHWLSGVRARDRTARRVRRLFAAASDLARWIRVRENEDGMSLVDAPFLQPALLCHLVGMARAVALARRFNGFQLGRIARWLKAERIIVANPWFDIPHVGNVPVYYDLADWFNESDLSRKRLKDEISWFQNSLSQTTANFAVSTPLVRKLAQEYQIGCHYLPNGVDLKNVRGVDRKAVAELRKELGLAGQWVLGFIGNHDAHAGLDFLLQVFVAFKRKVREAGLLVVGPYEYWKGRLDVRTDLGIKFTGPLPPAEMGIYAHVQDVAVHPCEKSDFRDYASPLKVMEATAARKFIISTDLLSLRDLQFPNVQLLERDVAKWVEMLQLVRCRSWSPSWDGLIERFDWSYLADRCADRMEESLE